MNETLAEKSQCLLNAEQVHSRQWSNRLYAIYVLYHHLMWFYYVYSQFQSASKSHFKCFSVDKEEIIVLFQVWQITSAQTGQAIGSLKWSIPNMKSGSHANISR